MKRQLMATVSLAVLTGFALPGTASAADLPARMPVKAAPPPAIIQLWAGPYIGINGGAVWHKRGLDTINAFGATEGFDTSTTGGTFGGQIGYNWQTQNFVFGVEADANWVGIDKTFQQRFNNGVGFVADYTTKLSWLATVRARGGVAFGRTLVFLTGGLAVGGVENSWSFAPPITCGGVTCRVSEDQTRVGWTAGGGIEHFISNPHVTVKAEALYVDLGKETVNGTGTYTSRFRNTAVIGRLGLNLKW